MPEEFRVGAFIGGFAVAIVVSVIAFGWWLNNCFEGCGGRDFVYLLSGPFAIAIFAALLYVGGKRLFASGLLAGVAVALLVFGACSVALR